MIRRKLGLDEKDREIISLLEDNPEMSQNEIAQRLELSQPSVGVRIRKLKERGIIAEYVGININKLGFNLSKVDITANNPSEILDAFRKCPYFVSGFIMSGKNNLCLFFVSEDLATLEAMVDRHLRSNPKVSNTDLSIIITSSDSGLVFPLKMVIKKQERTPCNTLCEECYYYESGQCLGCPYVAAYRGMFWSQD